MRMSNKLKHEHCVSLVSNYLIDNKIEHLRFNSDPEMDIFIPEWDKPLKIFGNFSKSKNIKISKDYFFDDNVVYLVVSPTRKNNIGFTCLGGTRDVIENSLVSFNSDDSPKNIRTDKLKFLNLKKLN